MTKCFLLVTQKYKESSQVESPIQIDFRHSHSTGTRKSCGIFRTFRFDWQNCTTATFHIDFNKSKSTQRVGITIPASMLHFLHFRTSNSSLFHSQLPHSFQKKEFFSQQSSSKLKKSSEFSSVVVVIWTISNDNQLVQRIQLEKLAEMRGIGDERFVCKPLKELKLISLTLFLLSNKSEIPTMKIMKLKQIKRIWKNHLKVRLPLSLSQSEKNYLKGISKSFCVNFQRETPLRSFPSHPHSSFQTENTRWEEHFHSHSSLRFLCNEMHRK